MVRCSPSRCTVTATRSPGSRSRTASVTSPGASTRGADADDDVAGAQAGVVGGRGEHHLTDRRAAARGALRGRHAWRTRPASARRIASVCATFVALTDAELPRDGAPRGGRALRDRPGAGGHRTDRALRRPDGVRRQGAFGACAPRASSSRSTTSAPATPASRCSRARDRRHLPASDPNVRATGSPPARAPVRRARAHRPRPRRGAARARPSPDARRATRDLPTAL